MLKNSLYFILILFLSNKCTDNIPHNISDEALDYLNEVLDILETNSINKHKIDWEEFRKDIFKQAQNIQAVDSTYPVIRYALLKLGDNHSHFISEPKAYSERFKTGYPHARLLEQNIAYLHLPQFMGNKFTSKQYASRIQGFIQSYSMKNISGWIVDLRENHGGNMWPMLAGIGPLVGEDVAGYFINADDKYMKWYYKDGTSYSEDHPVFSLNDYVDINLTNVNKIAVLIGSGTASSGEAIVVSFKGKDNTKFFGEPTSGLSTGNRIFNLSNNSALVLTTAVFADRNKKKYGHEIKPDEFIENPEKIDKLNNDRVILAAVDWIKYNE